MDKGYDIHGTVRRVAIKDPEQVQSFVRYCFEDEFSTTGTNINDTHYVLATDEGKSAARAVLLCCIERNVWERERNTAK